MSRSDQQQVAGDNSQQVQATGPVVINNNYGITDERAREIVLTTFWENILKLAGEAQPILEGRAREFIDEFVGKLRVEAPSGFQRFRDPWMLSAIFDAQKSYAETGDRSLGDLLSDLLVKLSTEDAEERTTRNVILKQALNCAPRLSAPQIRSLAVLTILHNCQFISVNSLAVLVSFLDAQLSPFYGRVPKHDIEYAHMDSCNVGTLFMGRTTRALLISKYPNVFYDSFLQDLIDRELHGSDPDVCEWIESPEGAGYRFTDSAVAEFITEAGGLDNIVFKNPIKDLCRKVTWSEETAISRMRALNSDLTEFLDQLDSSGAMHFNLNAAGVVIGYQAWKQVAPELAFDVDSLFVGQL